MINECGLKWDNVDLEAGTLTIQYQMMDQDSIIKLVQTKTRNAFRTICLHERALEYLRIKKRWSNVRKGRSGSV